MSNNNNHNPNRQFYAPEETGYSDPFGNCNDFNLFNFINSGEETPVDSPMDNSRMPPYHHPEQGTSRQIPQQNRQPIQQPQQMYYNPVVQIPQNLPFNQQQLKVSPGSEYQASNSSYSGASSNQQQSPVNGQISSHELLIQQHQLNLQRPQNTQYILDDIQQENLPIELYLNGNEDLSDLNINDFPPTQVLVQHHSHQANANQGLKRKRMEPVEDIKCEESYVMANNNNQCLLSNSSTNSSINNENACFDYPLDDDFNNQRMIRFTPFQPQQWAPLLDANQCQIPLLQLSLVADKGFSFSNSDNCFINQKKNHLQVTVLMKIATEQMPKFVYTDAGIKEIRQFKLDLCAVKQEMPSSEVQVRQSLSNRKTVPYVPEVLEIDSAGSKKKTVYRLHFADVTENNNRKPNKQPNPAQRYFLFVVKIVAETMDGSIVLVQAHASDKFICRASNPATFEQPQPPCTDTTWQRANNTVHYGGPVAIGTDKAINGAQLTVHGNIVSTGQHTRPSDRRVKENIFDVDKQEALDRIAKIHLVNYSYKPEIAKQWGLKDDERHRVGVIAQEVQKILPDAVRDNGEFLTVDDTRIFYDTVAAHQQLHQTADALGEKVEHVEELSVRVARYLKKRKDLGLSMASGLSDITQLLQNFPEQAAAQRAQPPKSDGMDNRSYVSHISLASSTAPSMEGASQICSASQYGRYYSKRGRLTSRDSSLCNSRLTQATMVGLVVVMSICLVAMCSLYVLDWYNRNYVNSHQNFPRPDSTHGIDNLIELTNWIPPTQPLVHPLLNGCVGALGAACPVYCCNSNSNPETTTDPLNSTMEEGNIIISTQNLLNDESDNSSPKPLQSGVKIELTDLNLSLDAKYCVDTSCNARKGKYNLYIPMSAYLPTIPLHVKFSADPDVQIDACGQYAKLEPKSCNSHVDKDAGLVPSIHKLNGNTFELSAGRFRQSAYRFRVGHTSDACAMPDEQQGRSFDEYNLIFYRKCVF